MPEPQVQDSAACPVHDEREEDDDEDDHHQPEEEHDDSGNCVPGYGSSSSHGLQLPGNTRIIRNFLWSAAGRIGGRFGQPVPLGLLERVAAGEERHHRPGATPGPASDVGGVDLRP